MLVFPNFSFTHYNLQSNFQIVKCSGHSGIIENELADRLANQDFTKFTKILEENGIEYKPNLIF